MEIFPLRAGKPMLNLDPLSAGEGASGAQLGWDFQGAPGINPTSRPIPEAYLRPRPPLLPPPLPRPRTLVAALTAAP